VFPNPDFVPGKVGCAADLLISADLCYRPFGVVDGARKGLINEALFIRMSVLIVAGVGHDGHSNLGTPMESCRA
jgi:hypothetical protein